jgi:Xaa-Pro aminopeptidase
MADDPERRVRVASALSAAGRDAVICVSPTDVLLLTGYWPVMGASVAILTRNGDVCVIVPEDEAELASNTSSARLIPYKPARLDELISPVEALLHPLTMALESMQLMRGTAGVESREQMQPASYAVSHKLNGSLVELLSTIAPGLQLVNWSGPLERLKARKTPIELDLIRRSARIGSSGFDKAPECIRPGMRENDVAADLQHGFETSNHAEQAHRFYGFFYCMSGPNSAQASGAYACTRQRIIRDGDLVLIHANTCADGYWTDITRTFVAGEESEKQNMMRVAINEARGAALHSIHHGARASDVDAAARTVMEQHGMGKAFRHSTGHGVGFAAANPNGLPRIHPKSPDILEEGMTFNIEPAAYFDGYGGMRHCDVVAVTGTGADVLTEF